MHLHPTIYYKFQHKSSLSRVCVLCQSALKLIPLTLHCLSSNLSGLLSREFIPDDRSQTPAQLYRSPSNNKGPTCSSFSHKSHYANMYIYSTSPPENLANLMLPVYRKHICNRHFTDDVHPCCKIVFHSTLNAPSFCIAY